MTVVTPVWVWLPGQDEPTRAGELVSGHGARFIYRPDYTKTEGALALDPVELRISRSSRGTAILGSDGLPGVVRDAKPAGYGADRLQAMHGGHLDALQLLELGVPDGVGAIEACDDIERKLRWRPKNLADLQQLAEELEAAEPASRALRRLNDDLETSAGGERPKATLVDEGRLWQVKMQARGDRPAMPAREFVTMRLDAVKGDPERSYLAPGGSTEDLDERRHQRLSQAPGRATGRVVEAHGLQRLGGQHRRSCAKHWAAF